MIELLIFLCNVSTVSWLSASMFLYVFENANAALLTVARWMYAELRPFYLPCAIVIITRNVVTGDILHGLTWLGDFFALLCWFSFKDIDIDDDRWKRRKARVLEKVKRLGSRLVVVPASGES